MGARRSAPILEALEIVAPGQPLREGLDRIIKAKMGALIVVADGPEVLNICSGGFLLDAAFSPQRLSELAKTRRRHHSGKRCQQNRQSERSPRAQPVNSHNGDGHQAPNGGASS